MSKEKKTLYLILFTLSFIFIATRWHIQSFADSQPTNPQKKDTSKNEKTVSILPLPRHIEFPPITFGKTPSVEGTTQLELSSMRFWYIVVIASWSPRCLEITEILNAYFEKLQQRKVGILALFSNDTLTSVENWRQKHKPLFQNEFASRDFLDSLKNPKVPTLWLIGKDGEILQNRILPKKSDILESMRNAMTLTDF